LTGKIATVDVWHLLRLYPYDRSMHEQHRLNEVMRVPVWRRKIIRHNAHRVGRGFRRGVKGDYVSVRSRSASLGPLAPVFVQRFQSFASIPSHSAVWWDPLPRRQLSLGTTWRAASSAVIQVVSADCATDIPARAAAGRETTALAADHDFISDRIAAV